MGGGLIAVEGDHGSFFCHPNTPAIQKVIQCFVDLQASQGGNALIGREFYPLLTEAGYHNPEVTCRTIYVDGSKPDLIDGFSKQTFIVMVEGIQEAALANKLIDPQTCQEGIRDLYRATEPDGTFCYSFFKAQAILPKP